MTSDNSDSSVGRDRAVSSYPSLICGECDAIVRLLYVGEGDGVDIGCNCHKIHGLSYYAPVDELFGPWEVDDGE